MKEVQKIIANLDREIENLEGLEFAEKVLEISKHHSFLNREENEELLYSFVDTFRNYFKESDRSSRYLALLRIDYVIYNELQNAKEKDFLVNLIMGMIEDLDG